MGSTLVQFSDYLYEEVGRKSIDDIVFRHLDSYDKYDNIALRNVLLPMSKKMSVRLFGERNRITAAHITSESHLRELKSMQGTQRSLACMTDPTDKSIWFEGVATEGGIVCLIEGYPTIISNIDLYSRLGPQGRRYIPLNSFFKGAGWEIDYEPSYAIMLEKLKDTLFDSILKARERIKYEITFDKADQLGVTPELQDWLYKSGWSQLGKMRYHLTSKVVNKQTAGKIKQYAIKRWFDEMERIWKTNWRRLSYMFDPELMSKRKEGWNEINLVDIKILGCYVVRDVTPLPDDVPPPPPGFDENEDPDTAGISILGYIDVQEKPMGSALFPSEYTKEGLRTISELEAKIKL